jgi:hypothetical protein
MGMACASGTPAPDRLAAFPVTASAPSDMPWKALVKLSTVWRPVTLRASFNAASTAFAPVGQGNWTFQSRPRGPKTLSRSASSSRRLATVDMSRPWVMPSPAM